MEERIRSFGAFVCGVLEEGVEVRQQISGACSSREPAEVIRGLRTRLHQRVQEEELWLVQHRLRAWRQALERLASLCSPLVVLLILSGTDLVT